MKPLIYVVDDDHSVRRLMEHWLKTKWEYNLQLFSSGEQCLEALDLSPDLIILDVMLPGISGVETLREIRKRDADTPVSMLSAQGQIDVVVETIKLGAMDYFPKTIDLNKLELAVRNALEMHSLKRELHQLRSSVVQTGRLDNIIASAGSPH